MSRTTDRASSAVTSRRRIDPPAAHAGAAAGDPRLAALRFGCRSTRDSRHAGASPKSTAETSATPSVNSSTSPLMTIGVEARHAGRAQLS
jgi:hypothetical protein